MNKFRFPLLAFTVAAITFVFTRPLEKNSPVATFYAFDASWSLLDSANNLAVLPPCPKVDSIFAAQVWAAIKDGRSGGVRIMDLLKFYTIP